MRLNYVTDEVIGGGALVAAPGVMRAADLGNRPIGLSFGGVPSTLEIPIDAVTGFADPAVQFGLRFHPTMPEPAAAAPPPEPEPAAAPDAPDTGPQVVSLDAFRRRTPPKD